MWLQVPNKPVQDQLSLLCCGLQLSVAHATRPCTRRSERHPQQSLTGAEALHSHERQGQQQQHGEESRHRGPAQRRRPPCSQGLRPAEQLEAALRDGRTHVAVRAGPRAAAEVLPVQACLNLLEERSRQQSGVARRLPLEKGGHLLHHTLETLLACSCGVADARACCGPLRCGWFFCRSFHRRRCCSRRCCRRNCRHRLCCGLLRWNPLCCRPFRNYRAWLGAPAAPRAEQEGLDIPNAR
mmetsp:Transcript_46891/g.140002  ORF Transcript_46891/g.140002 Transcript_46891/m.140002 type:complete len:240 (-) Transcript_46891:173-892(-)